MRRLSNALIPLLLFALALAIRALPWGHVVRPEHVYLHGHDSFYHMRRILYALANGQATLDFDPYIHYPEGARAIWPPLFDGALALLLAPFYHPGDERTLELAAIWAPPILGAATVVGLYFVARRHWGTGVGIASAATLSVLSAHFWYSQLGYVDHHVAIAAVATLLFAATLELSRCDFARPRSPRALPLASTGCGVAIALMLLLWPGGLLHVALCELCLFGLMLTRTSGAEARRVAACTALANGIAAMLLGVFGAPGESWAQWTPYSPVVLTRFQPWLLSSIALIVLGAWGVWRSVARIGQNGLARFATLAAIGLAVLLGSALALPDFTTGFHDAWQWLSRNEVFQAGVRESQPLFEVGGRFSTTIAEGRLSWFVYLFPLSILLLLLEARDPQRRVPALVLVAWALPLALVTLAQRRFFDSFSVFFALAVGWSIVRVHGWLCARTAARPPVRIALGCALFAIALVMFSPMRISYREPLTETLQSLRAIEADGEPSRHPWRPLLDTARWLREHTPQTSGYFDATVKPEYGVMSGIGLGHVIEYVGRRATIVNNFGDDIGPTTVPLALTYYATPDELEAKRILEALGARYVIADPSAPPGDGMMRRLFHRDGSGLAHHRMLYESPRVARSRAPRGLKIFELVRGAELVGQAMPGARVRARLELETNLERPMIYEQRTLADQGGTYHFRLPHANVGTSRSALTPAGAYAIDSAGVQAKAVIGELDVLEGRTIIGPDLRPGEGPPDL